MGALSEELKKKQAHEREIDKKRSESVIQFALHSVLGQDPIPEIDNKRRIYGELIAHVIRKDERERCADIVAHYINVSPTSDAPLLRKVLHKINTAS